MKPLLVSLLLFFILLNSRGQSINGVWLATNSTSCIEFDSTLHRMNIGDIHEAEWRTSKPRFIYSIKKDVLRIIWYYYNSRSVSHYKINYMKGGKLSLSNIKEGDGAIEELIGGLEIEFVKTDTCNSCSEYYKKKFSTLNKNN